jgi:phosphoribosylamine--glycine ligase
VIRDLDHAEATHSAVKLFHAGTKKQGEDCLAIGGRVLNICATAKDFTTAKQRTDLALDAIDWPEGFYRKDIGWRVVTR